MDPITMMLLSQIGGRVIGGSVAAAGGIIQLATGLSQLRKANQLPFPDYKSGMQYATDTNRLYKENFQRGLGQERMDIMRQNIAAQSVANYRNISQNAPQLAGFGGRIMALDKMNAENTIAGLDTAYRESQVPGLARSNAQISGILRTDVEAKRNYKLMAEQAAGAAIKQGSENIMESAKIFGGVM
jgi:hypothetical protein